MDSVFVSADGELTQSYAEPEVVFQAVGSSQDPVFINKNPSAVKLPSGIQHQHLHVQTYKKY